MLSLNPRFALLAQGEQIHIATYPPSWPFDRFERKDYNPTESIKIREQHIHLKGKYLL